MTEFKAGDWVVFIPSKGGITKAWDREMVLQVETILADSLTFDHDTLKRYDHFGWVTGKRAGSNYIRSFRHALPHEIPGYTKNFLIYN